MRCYTKMGKIHKSPPKPQLINITNPAQRLIAQKSRTIDLLPAPGLGAVARPADGWEGGVGAALGDIAQSSSLLRFRMSGMLAYAL